MAKIFMAALFCRHPLLDHADIGADEMQRLEVADHPGSEPGVVPGLDLLGRKVSIKQL